MVQDAFRRIAVPKTLRSLQYALFRAQGARGCGGNKALSTEDWCALYTTIHTSTSYATL